MKKFLNRIPKYWISLAIYFVLVQIIVLFGDHHHFFSKTLIFSRAVFLLIFILTISLKNRIPSRAWNTIPVILVFASLTLLYKETAFLNQMFYPEIDDFLVDLDEKIFGFQPALEFSKYFGSALFSELMFFGYFSYYIMALLILYILYRKLPEKIEEFGFLLITSFLLYYIVFVIVPSFGPQFYFSPPESQIEAQGFFGSFIKLIQENGEAKTAAFPSSHVGVALIMLIWLRDNLKEYLKFFIPSVVLLIPATVYIKAHYFVDAIAGILSAPIVYFTVIQFFKISKKIVKETKAKT